MTGPTSPSRPLGEPRRSKILTAHLRSATDSY
jgi:hypothetical protein